jgi:hypothetical protein
MADFSELEHEAEKHGKEADQGIEKAEGEGDKLAGGQDHGLIDKGGEAAEKGLANAEGPGNQGDAASSSGG